MTTYKVVLDLHDADTALAVAQTLKASRWHYDQEAGLQIEAQVGPPRIPEPTRLGVVEASCCHSDIRREWVRDEHGRWFAMDDEKRNPDAWDDLVDPVLVRDGVQP
jgi:hypothetical protein